MSEIIKALTTIMGEVGSVKKGGENKFHGYRYARAEDVAHALQGLLAKHGVLIIQTEQGVSVAVGVDRGAVLRQTYRFFLLHTSGETLSQVEGVPFTHTGCAQAGNSKGGLDDKALNKCHTAARKYFTLALFQIPTGDFADADEDEDQGRPAADDRGAARNYRPGERRAVAEYPQEAQGSARTAAPRDPGPQHPQEDAAPTEARDEAKAAPLVVRWPKDTQGNALERDFPPTKRGGREALDTLLKATRANRGVMDIPDNQDLIDRLTRIAESDPSCAAWLETITEIHDLWLNNSGLGNG